MTGIKSFYLLKIARAESKDSQQMVWLFEVCLDHHCVMVSCLPAGPTKVHLY
jgi:hypothetical protein